MNTSLPSPLLAIRAFGAVTNIGTSAAQTAASWIAQTRRQRKIKLEGFADPFTIADLPALTEGNTGVDRLFALLESAVAEALEDIPTPNAAAGSLNLLALPPWVGEAAQRQLADRLSAFWPGDGVAFQTLTDEAAAAWHALELAYRALDTDPTLRQVVIAAVDSLCEPVVLRQAAEAGALLQPGNSEGYIAGEAAACVVLTRVQAITALPAGYFALHRPAGTRQTTPHWPSADAPNPEALTAVLNAALTYAGMGPAHISHLLSDMDGSSWRAQIESTALTQAIFAETSALPHWRPATLLGQTGTATGLLGWLLPVLMHAHQHAQVNTVLNWTLTPAGTAAACVLERSPY